jgi:hypothetical protein
MKRRWMAVIAASALLAASGHSVRAQDAKQDAKKDNEFANKLYAADVTKQKKTYACFVRQYDNAHLAKHPLQKVSAMRLLVTAEVVPEDENLNHSFRLGVKFRNRPGNFDSSGSCGHMKVSEMPNGKEHLGCSVDCDGGGISVELTADNKATLIRLDSIRIWNNNKPDDEGLNLSGGADDRVFRLDRAPLEMCKSLVTDRQELAAMRRK